jgi:syntaxin 1B/2/3
MSYGYGQNPYDQRGQGGYGGGANPYAQQDGGDMEMQSFQQGQASDPNAILNECRDVERGVQDIETGNLEQIKLLQQQVLQSTDTSSNSGPARQLDGLVAETMQQYRSLTDRVRRIKGKPEARSAKNGPHVDRVDRRLRAAMNQFQVLESQFRARMQEQMARQYRIVKPDASEDEVREAVEDTSGQVFSQVLMQSDRRGQSRAVLREVEERNRELAKIERQMVELAQLFQDLDTMVIQQEEAVAQIEQKGEEIVENLDKGNEEIAVAVDTARSTRKKKWICLGIVVAIIAIIVIIVVIYFTVIRGGGGGGGNNNNNNTSSAQTTETENTSAKRSLPSADGLPLQVRQISRVMRRIVKSDLVWPPAIAQ